ncbi:MAG: hypothetical protein Q8880_04215, partial [Bacteroidota bacterium]|nr:hypothetical protein [Bacteroidota bacterium]
IHWSNYGMCLVIDSLIKYIENKRGIDIPEFYWNDIEITEKYREPDYDLGEGLNLIFKLGTSKLAYPKYIINDQKSKVKPNVLVIADSFYWGIFNMLVSKKIFNNSPFWYYNHEIYPQSKDKTRYVDQLNLKKEIEKQDIIILMQTEATLSRLSFGFIDSVYKIYKRDKK